MELNEVVVPDETEIICNEDNGAELNEVVVSDDEANYRPIMGIAVM